MKKITLMPNPYRDRGFQITRSAVQILNQHGAETRVCLPFQVDRAQDIAAGIELCPLEAALKDCELLICFGGDGTILHAARLVGNKDIPMLGINTGTMGFMAELESNELHLLPKLLEPGLQFEERMLIHVAVKRNGRVILRIRP